MRAITLVGLIALGAATPLVAQDKAINQALTAVYARFTEAYRVADPQMVADLYAEDAFYLQPNDDILRGRPSVMGVFQGMLGPIKQQGKPGPSIYFEIVERKISGNLGWDVGYYRMGPPGSDSATAKRGGKFIVLWRKDADGQWRIRADGYSGLDSR